VHRFFTSKTATKMLTISQVRTHEQWGHLKFPLAFKNYAVRKANPQPVPFSIMWVLLCVWLFALAPGAAAQAPAPLLLSESKSTRALALESIAFTKEPFPLDSLISWSPDRRTRVVLFALNLQLQTGEDPSGITADAEDVSHRHYALKVENAGPVPANEWMSALTIRLSDDLSDVGDVLVGIVNKGRTSNRVRIAIGHLGGGPPDDPGAKPTSPYLIRGTVLADSKPLPGAAVILDGSGSAVSMTTDSKGEYLIATVGGDYVLSAAKTFYDFSPANRTFTNLSSALDGVSFSATRQERTIAGVIREANGTAIPNIEVTLTGTNIEAQTTTADANGHFTFAEVPAGFAYAVTVGNKVFSFTAQHIDSLTDSTTLLLVGVRLQYTMSVHVMDGADGIADVTVRLKETGATAVTDAAGNYSFSGLTAGFDYTVMVAKEDYVFETSNVLVSTLDSNRQIDLRGHPDVFLTGRVVDQNGHGVFGVKIEVTGTQSGIAATSADGTYSFHVTAFGNYVIRPWKEQYYYEYSPTTISLTALKGNRVADFNGRLISSVSPSYVLEFDGTQKTVDYSMPISVPFDYNVFWPDGEDFGHFFWEFWAMPGKNAGATYMISDGYGGAHAILFGVANFGSREPNRYQLLGNIWNGSYLTYFASDEGPAANEWGHYAAGWDGKNIVIYFNGVPVGKTPWTGPRITPGRAQGCGRLLIGGSDHANFIGRIAQVRGYEQDNPRENSSAVLATFAPQTVFSVDGNLLSYFFRPSENIADLSPIGQYGRQHTGVLRSTLNGVLQSCNGCPLPQFVVDPTAPDFAHPNNPGTPPAPVDTPDAVPAGALVFDSFSRRNSTYALSGLGGLGSTEGGTTGTQTWRTNQAPEQPQPFGILNGRAVLLANATAIAWTNRSAGAANFDIRVDRHAGVNGTGHNTGLSFRVADASNYFFAYSSDNQDPSQAQTLTVGYYSAGLRTELVTGILMPTTWTTLQVFTTDTGTIGLSADGTPLYSTSNALLAGSVGAGLYNNGPGLALTNRWDNFLVFSLP
jgi:hypothetical protein